MEILLAGLLLSILLLFFWWDSRALEKRVNPIGQIFDAENLELLMDAPLFESAILQDTSAKVYGFPEGKTCMHVVIGIKHSGKQYDRPFVAFIINDCQKDIRNFHVIHEALYSLYGYRSEKRSAINQRGYLVYGDEASSEMMVKIFSSLWRDMALEFRDERAIFMAFMSSTKRSDSFRNEYPKIINAMKNTFGA